MHLLTRARKDGREPRRPVHVPGNGGRICLAPRVVKYRQDSQDRGMIKRSDILILGLSAGVIGSLGGGMMLGLGMALVMAGANIGWLLLLPAAPAGGLAGWVLARKLAKDVPPG